MADIWEPKQRYRWFQWAFIAGWVLAAAGLFGIFANGGLTDAQEPASTAAFNEHVSANLGDVRAANLADLVLFVPGYLLIGLGGAEWIRSLSGADGRVRRLAQVAFGLVAIAAVTDTIENVILRVASGDLPAGDGTIDAMTAFGTVKYWSFVVGFVLLAGTAAWRWWRDRASRAL